MKKLLLITMLYAIAISNLNAQIKTSKTLRNTQNLNLVIPPPPPPPPANSKTSDPISNTGVAASITHYYLSSAKVNIFTGNDNKELPSTMNVNLYRLSRSNYETKGDGPTLMYTYLMQGDNKQELKPNSNSEIALNNLSSFPYTFPGGTNEGYRYYEIALEYIQINGLQLSIEYIPNFILDAWKIEKVVLTLEFKDLNGNPHPTMATVTIPFLNANALLKDGNYKLVCETDKFLMPRN